MADSRNVVKNINLKGTSVFKLDISAATKFQKLYYDKIILEHVLLYKCSLYKVQNMHSKRGLQTPLPIPITDKKWGYIPVAAKI